MTPLTKDRAVPVAGLVAGAVVWGLIWYPYRVLAEAGIPDLAATLGSYLIALALGVLAFPRALRELRGASPVLAAIALAAGWTNVAYVVAMVEGEVMRVLLLFYLAPFWTVLLSRILLGERAGRWGIGVIALSLAGAFVMLWTPDAGAPLPQGYAEWVGLSAGLMFALSNVLARRAHQFSVEAKSLAIWAGVPLVTLPALLLTGPASYPATAEAGPWGLLVLVGIVLFAVNPVVQEGLARVPANRAIVIFMLELVVAAVASWLLTDEALTAREWAGGAMIAAASLFSAKMEAA